MYTKSLIQQYREILNIKESIIDKLNDLMDSYMVEDNIFNIKEMTPHEVESGYFVPYETYNSISEAINHMDIVKDSVRIQNNESFTIGRVFDNLSECSNAYQIFNINGIC